MIEQHNNSSCIFCTIRDGNLPSSLLFENDYLFVIQDIAPKAPIHYLIIPKKHIADVTALSPDDTVLMNQLFLAAQQVSNQLNTPSYRLVINNGKGAGQMVFHLHIHFLSGFGVSGMTSSEL